MEDKKDTFLVARIPSNLKKKIVKKAEQEEISISKVVRDILTKTLHD